MKEFEGKIKAGANIVLYDGVCGLCNSFVKFILQNDKKNQFWFASLQSDFAFQLLGKHGVNARDLDSVQVISNYGLATEKVYSRTKAVIFILTNLGGLWTLSHILNIIPLPLLNYSYNFIAKSRYKLFGKYETCLIPEAKFSNRFIEL